jgi:uncharacterized protein HemY
MRSICSLALLGLVLAGCKQYPNPNDLSTVSVEDRVEVSYKWMQNVVNKLDDKVTLREISDEEREQYIAKYAEEVMPQISADRVPPTDMWMYGDLLRITGRWKEAEEAFTQAVKFASGADRKINDTLRLAQAMAMNSKVGEAIKTAATVMTAKDADCEQRLGGASDPSNGVPRASSG